MKTKIADVVSQVKASWIMALVVFVSFAYLGVRILMAACP